MADQIKQTIRMYGPNDPYFWEVDNLPLEDLLENTARLQAQINEFPDFSIYATTGELEAQFVKIPDYNNRTLEDLEEDFNFSLRDPQENDVLLFTNGFWRSTDKDSRRDLFPKTIGDLHDVDSALNTPSNTTDGHVLKWQNGQWEAAEDIEYPYLNDLEDVTMSNPQNGDILYRSGSQWINGWPSDLPHFDDFNSPNDGDVLYYSTAKGAYVGGSFGQLPNQTVMFGGAGVEVVFGGLTVNFGDSTFNSGVSWRNRFHKATPGSNSYNAGGYKEAYFPIPNATLTDGTAYSLTDAYSPSIGRPMTAYITGMTSVQRHSSLTAASLELAFFNHLGNPRGCNFIHANNYTEAENTHTVIQQLRSFSAWVPIYWKNVGTPAVATPHLSVGIFSDNVYDFAKSATNMMHVRVLGIRT